jgi:hypothetical protein
MEELVANIRQMRESEWSYERAGMYMLHDFPRPEFYKRLFRRWGLPAE